MIDLVCTTVQRVCTAVLSMIDLLAGYRTRREVTGMPPRKIAIMAHTSASRRRIARRRRSHLHAVALQGSTQQCASDSEAGARRLAIDRGEGRSRVASGARACTRGAADAPSSEWQNNQKSCTFDGAAHR